MKLNSFILNVFAAVAFVAISSMASAEDEYFYGQVYDKNNSNQIMVVSDYVLRFTSGTRVTRYNTNFSYSVADINEGAWLEILFDRATKTMIEVVILPSESVAMQLEEQRRSD